MTATGAGHDTLPAAVESVHDEFLAASRQALRQAPGDEALAALGFWDLLDELGDPSARAALTALFRAQGAALATSGALGGLLAHPYLVGSGTPPASVAAAVTRRSARRGRVDLVVGGLAADHLLVDRPGEGAVVAAAARVERRPVDVPGRLGLVEVDVASLPAEAVVVTIPEERAAPARARSRFLGRVACSFEILGAAEAVLALAVEHAGARTQFGQPIGSFQAVRHLLAWARTDCAAIEAVGGRMAALDHAAPPRADEMLKALAGRNGRRVCERTLQVFGAIGFTAEHDHHQFHGRVLALDAVLGASAELARRLGRWLRVDGADPAVAATVLVPDRRAEPTP
jgi:hypothetical protein